MNASFIKRIVAYSIDVLIVMILSNMLSSVLPNNGKIVKKSEESVQILNEFAAVVDENDAAKIEEYTAKIDDLNYDLQKLSIYGTITTIGLYFLYFILFQRYNNGQTIGKRLLKIEVANSDGGEVSFKQLLIRGIIIYPITIETLNLILLLTISKSWYLKLSSVIIVLQYAILFICFITAAITKRGLHDRLANTVVMSTSDMGTVDEGKATKWQKNSEREKEIEVYKKSHTSGKRKE